MNLVRWIKKIIASIKLQIEKHIFLYKLTWKRGIEFGKLYGRPPNEKERDDISDEILKAWENHLRLKEYKNDINLK